VIFDGGDERLCCSGNPVVRTFTEHAAPIAQVKARCPVHHGHQGGEPVRETGLHQSTPHPVTCREPIKANLGRIEVQDPVAQDRTRPATALFTPAEHNLQVTCRYSAASGITRHKTATQYKRPSTLPVRTFFTKTLKARGARRTRLAVAPG